MGAVEPRTSDILLEAMFYAKELICLHVLAHRMPELFTINIELPVTSSGS
jgi:hypothetical protein